MNAFVTDALGVKIRPVSVTQWERLKKDFGGIEVVKDRCFSDPRFAPHHLGRGAGEVASAIDLLRNFVPPGMNFRQHDLFSARALHYRDIRECSGMPFDLDARLADDITWGAQFTQWLYKKNTAPALTEEFIYLSEIWLLLNDGSIVLLKNHPSLSLEFWHWKKEPKTDKQDGEMIFPAIAHFLRRQPQYIKIESVIRAEIIAQMISEIEDVRQKNMLILTAYHKPHNDDWANPQ